MKALSAEKPAEPCFIVRDVLTRVGDKWSVLAILRLGESTQRFSELKRTITGISQRMLTLTMRGLERDGFVVRVVYPTSPPRVDYALTPLGKEMLATVSRLAEWATSNSENIKDARAAFDSRDSDPPGTDVDALVAGECT